MPTSKMRRYTPQEYLELERTADFRSEYLDGEIFAMAGASHAHSLVATNLARHLGNRLEGRPCEVHGSDLRVRVDATGLYPYPDVSVVCGGPEFLDRRRDVLLNPTVIVEVLSRSTEPYGRGKKFRHYRQMRSLRTYVLVAQGEMLIEWYTRGRDGTWTLGEASGPGGVLRLEALGVEVPLPEIYAKVNFEEAEPLADGTQPELE